MAFAVAFALLVLPFSAVEGTFGVQIFGPQFSPFGASQSNGWVGLKSFPTHSGASETVNSEYSHALYPIGKHQFLRIPVKGGLKVVPAPKHLDLFKGNQGFVKHNVPLVKKPPLTSFGGYNFRESPYILKNSERPLISVPGTGNSIILIHGHPISHYSPLYTAGHLDEVSHSGIHSYKPIKIGKTILGSYLYSKSHPVKFASSIISSHHKGRSYPALLHGRKSDVGHSIIPSHHSSIEHDLSHDHHSHIAHKVNDYHSDIAHEVHDHHSDIEHEVHDHHSNIEHEVHDHHSNIEHEVHDHPSNVKHELQDHHSNIEHEEHDHQSDIAHEVHDHHSDVAHEVHDHHSDIAHKAHDHHSDIGHSLSHGHHSVIGHDTSHEDHSDVEHDVHDHHSDIVHDLHDHHSDIGHTLHDHHSDIEHGLSHGYHSGIGLHLSHGHSEIGYALPHVHTAHIKHGYHSIHDSSHSEIHDDDKDDEEEVIGEHGLDVDDEHHESPLHEPHIEEEHNSYSKKIRDYKLMELSKKIHHPITKTQKKIEEKSTYKSVDKNSGTKFPPSKHFKFPPWGGKEETFIGIKEEMIEKIKKEIMENMEEEMIEKMSKKMMEKMKEEMMEGRKVKIEDTYDKVEDMDDEMGDKNDRLGHVPIPRKPHVNFANPSYKPREIDISKVHKLEDMYKRFHKSHHRSIIGESQDFRKLHDKHHVHHPTIHEELRSYVPKIPKSHEAVKYSGGRYPIRPAHKYLEEKYYEAEEPEKTDEVGKKYMYFRKVPQKVEQQEQLKEDDYEPKHEINTKSDSYGHVQSHSYRESQRSKPVHYEYKSRASLLPRGRSKIYRNYEEPHTSSYAVEIQHSRSNDNAKKETVEDRRPIPKKIEVDRHETQQKEDEEEEGFDYLESQLSITEESLDGQKFGDKLKKE